MHPEPIANQGVSTSPLQQPTEITVTDSAGRQITLRKPNVLASYRFVELVGPSAKNEIYMAMAMPILFVAEIDGDPVRFTTKAQMEALITRLDDHGVSAVMEAVTKNWGSVDPQAEHEAVKK